MATKYGFAKQLKELRFLFCQTSEHSAATRSFLTKSYPTMKKHNPYTPILIREASGTEPKVFARYEFGKEKSISLKGLDDKTIEQQVTELELFVHQQSQLRHHHADKQRLELRVAELQEHIRAQDFAHKQALDKLEAEHDAEFELMREDSSRERERVDRESIGNLSLKGQSAEAEGPLQNQQLREAITYTEALTASGRVHRNGVEVELHHLGALCRLAKAQERAIAKLQVSTPSTDYSSMPEPRCSLSLDASEKPNGLNKVMHQSHEQLAVAQEAAKGRQCEPEGRTLETGAREAYAWFFADALG